MQNFLVFWIGLLLLDYFFSPINSSLNFLKGYNLLGKGLYFLLMALVVYISIFDFKMGWQVLAAALVITAIHELETEEDDVPLFSFGFFHVLKILLVLFFGWMSGAMDFNNFKISISDWLDTKVLLTIAVYVINFFPAGQFVGYATNKWRLELEPNDEEKRDSLAEAGIWIGRLERILVLTFVLLNQYEAIGFLIAAKSIIRFSDKSNKEPRKQTEYVLIGTLISFTIALFSGLMIRAID